MGEELYTIYKIYSKDNKYIYIGSTKDLQDRMTKHRQNSNNTNSRKYNYKIYKTIRENGGWNEFIVEKIEDIYTNKKCVFIRETELMKQFNSNMNSCNAYTSKEEVKKQKQEYRLKNKEKLKEKEKEYKIKNKEQIKEQKQAYRAKNKEKISEQKKEYRMKNKDKINEQRREYRMNKLLEKFKNEEKEKTINNITINITNLTINN